MSNTPTGCEVEGKGNGTKGNEEEGDDTTSTIGKQHDTTTNNKDATTRSLLHEDVVMGDAVVKEDEVLVVMVMDTITNGDSEDNGEASDETSSRRESNSSVEDLDSPSSHHHPLGGTLGGNDEDTTKLLTELDTLTSHTPPRKKKKKRRSKHKSSRTNSVVSRHNSAPDLTTPTTPPPTLTPTTSTSTTTTEQQQDKTPFEEDSNTATITTEQQQDENYEPCTPSSSSSASSSTAHIPQHLLDLTPPPTRGRSNAFYGSSKAVPPLIHSNSDGAAIIAIAAQNTSSALSKRNTLGSLSAIPEPSHSGLSKPKLFNYWRSFTGPVSEKSIVSHSKRFLVGFAETIGRRPSMEDYMVVHGAFRGRGHEDYFALFDGHGGKDAAAFAASHLHEVLAEKLKTNNAVKSLKEAFADTHKMISDQKIIGGTTAVVALFIGKKGFIANVGDTRAVLCRDGVPLRVSLDHKPELPTETMRIRKLGGTITTTYNSAGIATSRVNGMLAVSRALGDTPLHPYVSSDPEIHGPLNLDNEAKDQFVVLACDGVWDVLTDEEATSIVAPIANPEVASRRLRDEAFARGSTDNISVMVIRCPPFLPCD